MTDLNIIYSDDDEDISEKIYSLCDITEKTESFESVKQDLEDILRREDLLTDEKTVFSEEVRVIENVLIGEEYTQKIKEAIKEKIPVRYIFETDEGETVNLKLLIRDKNPLESLDKITEEFYKISPLDFLTLYFISNSPQYGGNFNKEMLIDSMNSLESITGKNFNEEILVEFSREVEMFTEQALDKNKKILENVKEHFSKLNSLPYSSSPDEISKTIEIKETDIEIYVREKDFEFDIDSGEIVFDEIKTTNKVPLVVYSSYSENFYKINRGYPEIKKIFDEEYKLEKNENFIYFFVETERNYKKKINLVSLDLKNSVLNFSYSGGTLDQVKKNIESCFTGIRFIKEKKKGTNGAFEIEFKKYDPLKLWYLSLLDNLVSNFLYVNETSNPRSLKKSIKFYFKNYSEDPMSTEYSSSFTLEKIYGDTFSVDFKSKSNDDKEINQFILTLSKIISYYGSVNFKETLLEIVETRYTGPEGIGLGGEFVPEKEKKIGLVSKKIDTLPDSMFTKNFYSRNCPCSKQPIIVDEEDREDWEEYSEKRRKVVLFPPLNSSQKNTKRYNFTCPDNDYPNLYFLRNEFGLKYPILPCCGSGENEDFLKDYDEILKNENEYWSKRNDKRVRREIKLGTVKILSAGQKGEIPEDLRFFLKKIDEKAIFSREGVAKQNYSSFIHCLFKASDHLKILSENESINQTEREKIKKISDLRDAYMERKNKEKEKIVNFLRENMSDFVNISVCSQEMFGYETYQILEIIRDFENIFESKKFYRILEKIFRVNIFVFVFEDKKTVLEKPNHNLFHIREYNSSIPSVFIFKHITSKTIETYELLVHENVSETGFPYLRGPKYIESLKGFIESKNYTTVEDSSISKNSFSFVNWNFILYDYQILSQDLNENGRLLKINISTGRGEKMSLFVKPSFPLDVKISKVIYKTTREKAVKIFGENFQEGSEGIWFPLKEFQMGVFIPCEDIRAKKSKNLNCFEYNLLKNIKTKTKEISEISTVRKNSNIIKQIILWLWNLSAEKDVDEWFGHYFETTDDRRVIDIINYTPLRVDYRFPRFIDSTDAGIRYYESFIPFIFSSGKINLYGELTFALKRFIQNYDKNTKGFQKVPNISFINMFKTEKDFKNYPNTTIIIGKKNYEEFYESLKSLNFGIEKIEDDYIVRRYPFNYKSPDGFYFLIQNTISNREKESFLIGMIWKKYKINIGYDFDMTSVWKLIKDFPMIMEFLQMTKETIIDLAKIQIPLEITSFEDALYYLSKDRIPAELKILPNVRYRNSEGKYEEIVKEGEMMIDIWRYGNGAYAAMLVM